MQNFPVGQLKKNLFLFTEISNEEDTREEIFQSTRGCEKLKTC